MRSSLLTILAALSLASAAASTATAAGVPNPRTYRRPVTVRSMPVRPAVPTIAVAPRPMPTYAPARPPSPLPNLSPQFDRAARQNSRGYDPSAAIAAAGAGGAGGRYATQAVPVTQARQGTQAQQYRAIRIVRPSTFGPIPWRRYP